MLNCCHKYLQYLQLSVKTGIAGKCLLTALSVRLWSLACDYLWPVRHPTTTVSKLNCPGKPAGRQTGIPAATSATDATSAPAARAITKCSRIINCHAACPSVLPGHSTGMCYLSGISTQIQDCTGNLTGHRAGPVDEHCQVHYRAEQGRASSLSAGTAMHRVAMRINHNQSTQPARTIVEIIQASAVA